MGFLSDLFGKDTNDIRTICDVNLEKYLGTWYEIARLPHSFEKDLENATASYSLRNDGKIQVVNAGVKNGEKKEAKAVAWVPDDKCKGRLLVSFFWPFKGEYKIILLDKDYQYAVVTSDTRNYLWILSRNPEISDELYNELIKFTADKGFDTSKIIKVKQGA